ncbi:ATPase AAA domain-containing protein 2B [Entomortierella lignicola]|nr:ATPase AAA domain-containing protein 2B [Entomortierella lignicola]
MDHDPTADASTPSTNNDPFTLKRGISNGDDDDLRLEHEHEMARAHSTPTSNAFSDNDMNDSKRRKIQGENDPLKLPTKDNTNEMNLKISNGNRVHSLSTTTGRSSRVVTETSVFVTSTGGTHHQSQSLEPDSKSKSLTLRRQTRQVNYAEEGETEEGDDDDDELEDTPRSRGRGQSRSDGVQSRPTSRRHLISDGDDDSEKSTDVKSEQKLDIFGPRTLRDRRSIAAPKPFPVGNPPPRRQSSRPGGYRNPRQSGRRYDDSSNPYQSNSRSLPPKRPLPIARPITENMRITRGMSGSLAPESPNSRDVTPDHSSRQSNGVSSRFHHSVYSEEERDLDDQDRVEDEELEDEELEEGPVDDDQSSNIINQDDNGLTRMTRLRARIQTQSATNSRHTSQRSSRLKPNHSTSQQEVDRKYDLRERPKNRPTYIADRPIPLPSRPRSSRIGNFGRDAFSRPRQGRSSLLEALARAGASSSDEHDIPNFKRRTGASESRTSSSRILPMNIHELADSRRDVIASRSGQLADTDPLAVGNSVDFDKVGGLDHHIKSLKEMVILPLLYPEVYSHFQMMPPRGVLFHGPPGTGKTLLARALASSCSTETQKVAFFMRKGADCLSKWVGEAERQLRLLFEEAKAWQPSIIFFDEIDGLCPVRSSKQEQIHASIVSTMLALMDGLDGRGQVIVIGATNRIDAIDPALRRPGRFDREFYFPLPNEAARRAIIDINTCGWVPALDEGFKNELARMTTRYCGADIKALCTEAALRAIRRRYPQIYESNEKLQIDASSIVVEEVDMLKSAKALTPASYRVTGATASPLPDNIKPLLQDQFNIICGTVDTLFSGTSKRSSKGNDNEDNDAAFQAMGYRSFEKLKTFRPRMIVTGKRGMGQRYIGPALLHYLEGCMVQHFDLAALMSESSRTPEAACVQYFIEVKRHAPSVIYIPHIDVWWSVVSDAVKATFSNLLEDLNPEDGILLLATSEMPLSNLPIAVKRWFLSSAKGRVELSEPESSKRGLFFKPLIEDLARPPLDFKVQSVSLEPLEQLKKAPPPQPRVPTAEEKKLLMEHDQYVLRELRITLRNIVDELYKERKFKPFFRPVEPEESVDYYQVIKKPMDLSTISEKINDRMYLEVKEFLADIDLIVENTVLYYDHHDPNRVIYRARAFQDVAYSMVGRLDPDLIIETEKTATRFRQEAKTQQKTQGERISRRRLGLEAPAVLDDPEILLRNRSLHSKLAQDSTRDDSVEVSIKMEDAQGQSQNQNLEPFDQLHIKHTGLDDEGEDSGTSLSLASSRLTSSVNSLTALGTGPEENSSAVSIGSMDLDSVELNVDSAETAVVNTGQAENLSMQTEDVPVSISTTSNFAPDITSSVTSTSGNDNNLVGAYDADNEMLPEESKDIGNQNELQESEPIVKAEEEPKELILDLEAVNQLQEALVKETEYSSIEELDQLRASLYTDIWEHRHEWNKSALLADMKNTLSSVTGLHHEYRMSEQKAMESFMENFQ